MDRVPSPHYGNGREEVPLVCPQCKVELVFQAGSAHCSSCQAGFPQFHRKGIFDFVQSHLGPEKKFQRAIYDGNQEANIRLNYKDSKELEKSIEDLTYRLKYDLPPTLTLRGSMDLYVLDRAGLSSGMEVLDIGCSQGTNLNIMSQRYGIRGTGIDLSGLAIRRAVEHNIFGCSFHLADAEKIPFPDASFDAVTSFDVLEHLPHQEVAVAEACRIIKPGGRIVLYCISSRDTWTWHWMQRKISGGFSGIDDGGGHRRELFLDPETTARWIRGRGFASEEIIPFHAFFSLIADERLCELLLLLARLPRLYRMAFRLFRWADLPLTSFGLGNGFYILGRKMVAEA